VSDCEASPGHSRTLLTESLRKAHSVLNEIPSPTSLNNTVTSLITHLYSTVTARIPKGYT